MCLKSEQTGVEARERRESGGVRVGLPKIRNPKFEVRNKLEIRIQKPSPCGKTRMDKAHPTHRTFRINSLYLHNNGKTSDGCTWDLEHCWGALLREGKVAEVGGIDEAFESYEA